MIRYDAGRFGLAVICKVSGSVFPRAAVVACLPACLTFIVRAALDWAKVEFSEDIIPLSLYNSFTWVLGFVVVFRTGIAYNRYWDGVNHLRQMGTEWYDVAAQVTAFAQTSAKPLEEIKNFQGMIVRLTSLMHCFALQRVCEMEDENFEVVDLDGMNPELLKGLNKVDEVGKKVEIVFQWLQLIILQSTKNGMIDAPAPIVARSFAQMNSGMVEFQKMATITDTPFPFPYTQMIAIMLTLHSLITPLLLGTMTSANTIAMGLFTFVQVFALTSLNLTAQEIEQPFGDDANDLECAEVQQEINSSLYLLLETHTQSIMTYNPSPKGMRKRRSSIDDLHLLTSDGASEGDQTPKANVVELGGAEPTQAVVAPMDQSEVHLVAREGTGPEPQISREHSSGVMKQGDEDEEDKLIPIQDIAAFQLGHLMNARRDPSVSEAVGDGKRSASGFAFCCANNAPVTLDMPASEFAQRIDPTSEYSAAGAGLENSFDRQLLTSCRRSEDAVIQCLSMLTRLLSLATGKGLVVRMALSGSEAVASGQRLQLQERHTSTKTTTVTTS